MSRFFFHVVSPNGNIIDAEGLDLTASALGSIDCSIRSVIAEFRDRDFTSGDEILVVDKGGCTVARVPLRAFEWHGIADSAEPKASTLAAGICERSYFDVKAGTHASR